MQVGDEYLSLTSNKYNFGFLMELDEVEQVIARVNQKERKLLL